ncbi:hypothetical protein B0H17DRAFT_983138, partial [Mycena rosella]
MLHYLSSYSGLARLTVNGPARDVSPPEELALADVFFLSALTKYAETLVHLSCSASVEGKWGFTPSNSDVLSRMPRLKTLMTSVNMADLRQNGDTVELLLDAIPNLPSLTSIIGGAGASAHVLRLPDEIITIENECYTELIREKGALTTTWNRKKRVTRLSSTPVRLGMLSARPVDRVDLL